MNPKTEVTIHGRGLEITEAIETRVNEMASKLSEHDEAIVSLKVELELERHATTHHDEFSAKAILNEKKEQFVASAKGDDLYVAIADLSQKLDRLIRRKSRRRVTERRHPKAIDLDADLPKVRA